MERDSGGVAWWALGSTLLCSGLQVVQSDEPHMDETSGGAIPKMCLSPKRVP